VNAVHPDGVDGMKVGQRLAILVGKTHVMADLLDGPAGLDASEHVPMRQVLMFQTYLRPSEDPDLP
jgi:hypothetical protein